MPLEVQIVFVLLEGSKNELRPLFRPVPSPLPIISELVRASTERESQTC